MASTEQQSPDPVPAEAFVRTYAHPSYADPWDVVEDYQRVQEYHATHPNLGSSAVSTRLDLPRGRIRQWMEGSKPDCLHGLHVAESNGWIGVDMTSTRFRGLNALLAWAFSGGSLGSEWYVPYWVTRDAQDRRLIDRAAELAGTKVDFTRSVTEGRAREVRPVENASALGRVLVVLGAPVGGKNENSNIRLPNYLTEVSDQIAREFVGIYLHNRAQTRENTDMLLFREERSPGYLESLAGLIRRLTGESVSVSEKNVIISAAAAREMAVWDPLLDVK